MGTAAASIRRKLIVCAATAALTVTASGPCAAAASPVRPDSGAALPLSGPNFTGIFLSTWGTSHVAFGDGFKSWLAQTGATVSAQAPVTLDADRGGFTMPTDPATGDRLDASGRMVYPGGLVISLPARTSSDAPQHPAALRLGPMYIRVVPDVSWSAALSVDGASAASEVELATADYAEVLAGGGTPSPSGFRAASVPFRLSPEAADLLAGASGRAAPDAGSLFGTLAPRFDYVPTAR